MFAARNAAFNGDTLRTNSHKVGGTFVASKITEGSSDILATMAVGKMTGEESVGDTFADCLATCI